MDFQDYYPNKYDYYDDHVKNGGNRHRQRNARAKREVKDEENDDGDVPDPYILVCNQ